MIQVIGLIAGALTTLSFLPQALQIVKTHNTKGISLPMYIIFVSGIFLWIIYGFLIHQPPVYLPNIITFILGAAILIMKLRYG